jgi:hypothetical protein
MESALSSLILFTVGIFAAMTISHTFLESQDVLWTSEQARQEESLARERTELEILATETQGAGSIVRVQVRNSGQTKLADFEAWDVIVQYYSDPLIDPELYPDIYNVAWLPYTAGTPSNMQWSVSGIYVNANTLTPEVYEPGILNPDEEMVIQVRLAPSIAMTTTNHIVINTPNGISASAHVIR